MQFLSCRTYEYFHIVSKSSLCTLSSIDRQQTKSCHPQKRRWLLIGGGHLQSIPTVLQEIHQSQSLVKQMLKARSRKKWKEVNREEKIYRKQTNKQISKKQNKTMTKKKRKEGRKKNG